MVNENKGNREIKDMKGWRSDVGSYDQYKIRDNAYAGKKNYPWNVAAEFCDIPKDIYQELLLESKTAEYEPYYAFNFAYVDHPWAHSIVEKYEEIYGCLYLRVDQGTDCLPHCDPVRSASIIAPLCYDDEHYTPLEIYADETIYTIGKTEVGKAWAWNCKAPHAVFNKNHGHRINLQFNIGIPYRDFYQKYIDPTEGYKHGWT